MIDGYRTKANKYYSITFFETRLSKFTQPHRRCYTEPAASWRSFFSLLFRSHSVSLSEDRQSPNGPVAKMTRALRLSRMRDADHSGSI